MYRYGLMPCAKVIILAANSNFYFKKAVLHRIIYGRQMLKILYLNFFNFLSMNLPDSCSKAFIDEVLLAIRLS